jgi:hypothetical protein
LTLRESEDFREMWDIDFPVWNLSPELQVWLDQEWPAAPALPLDDIDKRICRNCLGPLNARDWRQNEESAQLQWERIRYSTFTRGRRIHWKIK